MSVILMATSLGMDESPWRAINDDVMGGISSGSIKSTPDGLRFSGELSLENNGGFASVRRLVEQDLEDAQAVRLEVRGDGRSYQFRIRQDDRFDGVAWSASFNTGADWQTVELRLEDFQPVFRGRTVPGAGPVDPAKIRQIGFLIADKNAGEFALEVRSIEFRDGASATDE